MAYRYKIAQNPIARKGSKYHGLETYGLKFKFHGLKYYSSRNLTLKLSLPEYHGSISESMFA